MQAEFQGTTIITTPEGFKVAGRNNTEVYPKTVDGLLALTKSLEANL